MSDLNKRIAKIAGWTGIEVFTPAKSGLRGHLMRDGQHLPPHNIPNFLAPENLHLLWAVFLTVFRDKDWSLVYDRYVKDYAITWGKNSTTAESSATIQEALAEAIIEVT